MEHTGKTYDKRLNPCKHCGGEAYVYDAPNKPGFARVICSNCGITTPYLKIHDAKNKRNTKSLIKAWNASASQATLPTQNLTHTKTGASVYDAKDSALINEVHSNSPLFKKYRYTCCGYEFSEPLCTSGYKPIAKSFCPKCGTSITNCATM